MSCVHLFEDAVLWAASANDVRGGPSVASCELLTDSVSRDAADLAIANRGRCTGCNFCQDVRAAVH